MTQEEYIKTHPEQFKDEIDKWLFTEFGIIGGCCSAEKSHEYAIARMVAENITDAFIEKACDYLNGLIELLNDRGHGLKKKRIIDGLKQAMKGE